jgi:hypothetical protein
MSIYAFFCCTDCKVNLWLGKTTFGDGSAIVGEPFHIGPEGSTPNSQNRQLMRAMLKMLAQHHGHTMKVLFDYELDRLPDRDAYREIGGDCEGDVSFAEYLGDEPVGDSSSPGS